MVAWRSTTAALAASTLPLLVAVTAWPLEPATQRSTAEPAGYSQRLALTDRAQRVRFDQGRRLFEQRWVVAPSAFGEWGRGPLSSAEACSDCHAANGRGRPPLTADEPVRTAIVRLSTGPLSAPLPHPAYGVQLQHEGVLGKVPGEGEAYVDWVEHTLAYADATTVTLRAPHLRFAALAFGPIHADTRTSLRVAPPLIGLGLLESVASGALEALAASQRAAGYAGRLPRVGEVTGRFGHKAAQPSLRMQIAAALHLDIGVTSSLYREEDCTPQERACRAFPVPGAPEIRDEQLQLLEDYLRALAPPARRKLQDPQVGRGEQLFVQLDCAVCHAPGLQAGRERIQPYSDLLLHDLGAALADGQAEGSAGGSDWRTAPLWGLGLSQAVNGNAFLLHDGRARGVDEAILWHGGEAQRARDGFRALPAADREALIAFLESL
jgi:CxxC motif-containing protein (DUF1111 family)